MSDRTLNETVAKNTTPESSSRFPQTVVAVSREEFIEPIELTVRDAQGNRASLPDDLQGHYFIVSPAGSPNSATVAGDPQTVWVSKDGWTALYNGDGMVYRFDFAGGKAHLKTRLLKPPCYFADRATADPQNTQYDRLKFYNLGISRASFNILGIRNQLNTAFVPFKLSNDESERLLITWDVGRPYEIDPLTLETLTPVGMNQSWTDLLPNQKSIPFKNVMTSAHPVFDFAPEVEKLYTLNVCKSYWTMLSLPRALNVRLKENSRALKAIWQKFRRDRNLDFTQSFGNLLVLLYSAILFALKAIVSVVGVGVEIFKLLVGSRDFTHLLAWDGKQVDICQKWNIVLPFNRPLNIRQTVHQMGITRDYIVFADTSFKFSLESTLPFAKNSLLSSFIVFITDFLNYPQDHSTNLYIVKKADLAVTKPSLLTRLTNLGDRSRFKHLPKVVAQKVEIKPEFSHYLLDYDHPQGQIVLHASHLAAADIAEYIRIYDRSAYDNRDPDDASDVYDDPELTYRLQQITGNIVSPTDISRLGKIVIDVENGTIIEQQQFPNRTDRAEINRQIEAHTADAASPIDPKYLLTWSTAFYVYRDRQPTPKLTDIFWNSWGTWPDTLTNRAIEAYTDYEDRLVELNNVVDLTYRGVPSSLCHLKLDSDSNGTKIALNLDNYYQFNNRTIGTSAQFIPRSDSTDQTDGYIVCVVLTSDRFLSQPQPTEDPAWSQNSEVWIFDARLLQQGPLYKMSHPKLNIGFSFHTTWMSEAKSPQRRLEYDVRADYEYRVQRLIEGQPELASQVRELFDNEVYPQFESAESAESAKSS